MWDMSGHSDYVEVRNELFVDTQACLMVYDVTNRSSFENLEYWLAEFTHSTAEDACIAVVANKVSFSIIFVLKRVSESSS